MGIIFLAASRGLSLEQIVLAYAGKFAEETA